MTPDVINLIIGLGVGSIAVALIQGFFTRGGNKATAAKLVTDTSKLANDMVREVANDLRADNELLRKDNEDLRDHLTRLTSQVSTIDIKLNTVLREIEYTIPYVERGLADVAHATHLREVVRLARI